MATELVCHALVCHEDVHADVTEATASRTRATSRRVPQVRSQPVQAAAGAATAKPVALIQRQDAWIALAVAAISALAYADHVAGGFRANDTLPLIESARLHSLGDLWSIASERLMHGTGFRAGPYFRPISTLTFSLDERLWGIDRPSGYVVTNVVLQASVAAATFVCARLLVESRLAAFVGALVVALHPLGLEVVPAPPRRMDLLATLFALCCIAALRAGPSKSRSVVSAVALGLAVLSKESGLFALVPAALLVYRDSPVRLSWDTRFRECARRLAPHVLAITIAATWRTLAIGQARELFSDAGASVLPVSRRTAVSLLWPLNSGFDTENARMWPALMVVVLLLALLFVALTSVSGDTRRKLTTTALVGGSWVIAVVTTMLAAARWDFRTVFEAVPGLALIVAGTVAGLLRLPEGLARRSLLALIVVSTVAFCLVSPVVHHPREWDTAAETTGAILAELDSPVVATLPRGSHIEAPNVPSRVRPNKAGLDPVRSATGLHCYSLVSYLHLKYPNRNLTIDNCVAKRFGAGLHISDIHLTRAGDRVVLSIPPGA